MSRRPLAVLALALCLAAVPLAGGARAAPETAPPTYVMALPSAVTLIAWLAVDGAPDKVDLDLRVEAVLPKDCHDKIAGLLLRGTSLADDGAWDVVVERASVGECEAHPVRVSSRRAIRVKLAVGGKRELVIGTERFALARDKAEVSWNGRGPEGDLPGAPATGKPEALVAVELAEVRIAAGSAHRIEGEKEAAIARVEYRPARWPECVVPLGFIGKGNVESRFNLTRFELLARLPQDRKCPLVAAKTGKSAKTDSAPLVVRLGERARELPITVAGTPLTIEAPPSASAAKK